jgi:hypothetical protein
VYIGQDIVGGDYEQDCGYRCLKQRENNEGDDPFKPGQSGNPKGRPKGARNRLGTQFLEALEG